MRNLILIFLPCLSLFSCVKQSSKDPVPELEFISFEQLGKNTGVDSAVFTLGYKDWDGDLFRNKASDGNNIIITTYIFVTDSSKFIQDGLPFSYAIVQPADGYYKGQAIQGEIRIPVSEFRTDPQPSQVVKFDIFMMDMKNNKSNVLTTPQFTLN